MKMKHKLVGLAVITAGVLLAIGADYTVPRVWTRSGAEFCRGAHFVFDPLNTDLPVQIIARVKVVGQEGDRVDVWTAEKVSWLPAMITVNGESVTNLVRTRLENAFARRDLVLAYNWGLVEGREASMIPIPPPPPEPEPEP